MRIPIALIVICVCICFGCSGEKAADPVTSQTPKQSKTNDKTAPTNTLKELKITDIKPGQGKGAEEEDLLLVTYVGKLISNGKQFDSNDKPESKPFAVYLGTSPVIKGWHQGLKGMKKGGTRKLEIPYALAYGEAGNPPNIPEKADLVFEIKLLELIKKGEEGVWSKEDIKQGQGREIKKGDTITVHYQGWLVNGKLFDSSVIRKKPITVKLGTGQIATKGWEVGLLGMKVGGKRKLYLPPGLAFGRNGPAEVGNDQPVIFEIELLKIG